MIRVRLGLLLLACIILVSACDSGPSTPAGNEADPTGPRPLPSPTSLDRISETPDSKGRYEISPVSAPVEVGVPYRYRLFTRCGLDLIVDFNGTLWQAVDPAGSRKKGPPEGFEVPRDQGVMTLVNQELAEYESSMGKTVRFIRDPGTKKIKPCRDAAG